MKQIKTRTAFLENKPFRQDKPWDVNYVNFKDLAITPPHYADTIEVVLCSGIGGEVRIGNRCFEIENNKFYYIAPNIIHSMQYTGNGTVRVMKIEPKQLMQYMNINSIISKYKKSLTELECVYDDFDKITKIADTLSDSNIHLTDKLSAILDFFKILLENSSILQNIPVTSDNLLKEIISWTEENFDKKITLEEVADKFGYNKRYFCSKFKNATGVTYLNYLNNLRIHRACKMLKNGNTIKEVCNSCGFDNISYFIQLFKKIMNTTPKKYADEK